MEKRLSLMSFFPNQVTTTTIFFLCACFDPKFDNYILLYNFCNRTKINQKKKTISNPLHNQTQRTKKKKLKTNFSRSNTKRFQVVQVYIFLFVRTTNTLRGLRLDDLSKGCIMYSFLCVSLLEWCM